MFQFIVYESKTHHEDNYKIIILQQGLIFIVLQIHYLFAHTRLTPVAMNLFSQKDGSSIHIDGCLWARTAAR